MKTRRAIDSKDAMQKRRMVALRVAILAGVALAACPGPVFGDGCLMPPVDGYAFEQSQTALIAYDAETQTEEMVLFVSFNSDSRDFAWIVPVPALPVIETESEWLFSDAAELTRPVYRHRENGLGCQDKSGFDGDIPGDVIVYDDAIVGIYQTFTLGASDAGALADSLEAWYYLHEDNREAAEAAFQHYIDKSWYFVAMRIANAGPGPRPYTGYLEPVKFTFASEEPVYPMRISAMSAPATSDLFLFVCAQHRMTFPGAETEYANRFSRQERQGVGYRLLPYIAEGTFFTRLHGTLTPSDMQDDIILVRAEDDSEFRILHYSGFSDLGILPCALLGAGLFVSGWLWRRSHRSARPH